MSNWSHLVIFNQNIKPTTGTLAMDCLLEISEYVGSLLSLVPQLSNQSFESKFNGGFAAEIFLVNTRIVLLSILIHSPARTLLWYPEIITSSLQIALHRESNTISNHHVKNSTEKCRWIFIWKRLVLCCINSRSRTSGYCRFTLQIATHVKGRTKKVFEAKIYVQDS